MKTIRILKQTPKPPIMKKLFITALLAIAATAGAFATPTKVSSAILANFNLDFKEASDVTWLVTNDYTKAAFTADNIKKEVYYNSHGDIIATSKSINTDELPMAAKRSFAKKFDGYNVIEAIKFEGFDELSYYISGENDKGSVILKVNEQNDVSVFERTKK